MANRLKEFAPAKINVGLAITGRRADGYHLLDSRFGFADIGDWLSAEEARSLCVTITGPFAAGLDGFHNSVMDAARGLQEAAGIGQGARITLEKNLPVASGIGGGSADAAATLRLLTRLWDLPPTLADQIALPLGADVPACLHGKPVQVTGIGEILTPVEPVTRSPVVLVNPGIALSTPSVFREFARSGAPFSVSFSMRNDLQNAASSLCPAIGDVLAAIESSGAALTLMSGSGATCFGTFNTQTAAADAAAGIAARHPNWWVRAGMLDY